MREHAKKSLRAAVTRIWMRLHNLCSSQGHRFFSVYSSPERRWILLAVSQCNNVPLALSFVEVNTHRTF